MQSLQFILVVISILILQASCYQSGGARLIRRKSNNFLNSNKLIRNQSSKLKSATELSDTETSS